MGYWELGSIRAGDFAVVHTAHSYEALVLYGLMQTELP